jgi:DNA-binding FrmR family transcriptional regulator
MSDCCDIHKHPDHVGEVPRLNRIAGQIDGVKKMIEERRYCPDIMTQLRAARAALKTVEASILETHLNACVTEAMVSGDKTSIETKISEIRELFKRFND